MKTKFSLALLFMFGFSISVVHSQESLNAGGGNIAGGGGSSVSYSIGQVVYLSHTGTNGSVNEGVQQPIEFFSLSTDEQLLMFSVDIFPNPVQTELTVDFKEQEIDGLSMVLTDVNGKLIQAQNVNASQERLDMNNLARSNYFLNFYKVGKVVGSYQLIKN